MLPEIVREDGLGWAFGRAVGAYGQMHCISLTLQALRDAAGGEANLLDPILGAVKAQATVGEIADALREVFGEYRPSH